MIVSGRFFAPNHIHSEQRGTNYNLRKVLPNLGLITQLKNEKYAVLGFSPQIGKEKNAHDRLKRKHFRSLKPEEMAYLLKETPAKARDLLYIHVPGYSEPREEGIKWSNEKLVVNLQKVVIYRSY
jgi:hypothetical protein